MKHPDGRVKNVNSPEEEAALVGQGWTDKPLPTKPPVAPQNLDEPFCAHCKAQREAFDKSWDSLTKEHGDLLAAHSELSQRHAAVVTEFGDLQAKHLQLESDARDLLAALNDLKAKSEAGSKAEVAPEQEPKAKAKR